ncbi:tRNA pseudouridine(55) synthase TruB, partial [Streptomyces sp. NPDC020125]
WVGVAAARTMECLGLWLENMPRAVAAAAAFPRWDVDDHQARLLGNGVRIDMPSEGAPGPSASGSGPVAVFGPEGRFLALVEESKGKAKSLAVFV